MLKTCVEYKNGKPFISINDELHYPLAYTTYFDECGEFSDFIQNGYRMFFVNVSFTDKPINNLTGFTPFRKGVFETEIPDYSDFDKNVKIILDECPDAFIFPRINIAMPRKWIEENPYETVETPKGGKRESLASDAFLRDGTRLLKTLVAHIRNSDYSGNIAGYQICGGITQEWMHHDLFGSFCDMGLEKFRAWMKTKHGTENAEVPTRELFTRGTVNETTRRFVEFSNESAANAINHFARELKEFISHEQLVGAFYGYSAYVGNNLYGLHGLHNIIDSPHIDFFSAPCAYDNKRMHGTDWGDMIPVDSLKLHGKFAFIECDIRTHLSRRLHDSRPGEYNHIDAYALTDDNGNKTVWAGPDTPELSLSAIRKTFAHQLTKNSGIWWFDMWGGWYHDEILMNEIGRMKDIAASSTDRCNDILPPAEAALFVDERAYGNIPYCNPLDRTVKEIRSALSHSGIPFDIYMVEDAEKVTDRCRAAVFTAPIPSEAGLAAMDICRKKGIPFISSSEEKAVFTTEEMRDFLTANGLHCYNNDNHVIYTGNGILAIYSIKDGEAVISLPGKYTVKALFGTALSECNTDTITLDIKQHDTVILSIEE